MDSSRQTTSLCKDTGHMHRTPQQCLWLLLPHFPNPNLCCLTDSSGISHSLKCNRNAISSASPSPLTSLVMRVFAFGLALKRRQNIMTSLLLYIFHMSRNRRTHQGYTPPQVSTAIYPYPNFSLQFKNKLLFDHKDLAAERLQSCLSVCLQMGIQALCPDLFLIWDTTGGCWVCHCC